MFSFKNYGTNCATGGILMTMYKNWNYGEKNFINSDFFKSEIALKKIESETQKYEKKQ